MRFLRILILGVALLSLGSCARPVEKYLSTYSEASPCCVSASEFDYAPLEALSPELIAISAENPLYAFQGGRSYFVGFKLPSPENQFTIDILSSAIDNTWGSNSSWFYPVITIYDSDYRKIRTYDSVNLIFRSEESFWGDQEMILEAKYQVRGIDRPAGYVVVHTRAKMLDYAVEISTPSSGYSYMVGSQVIYVPGSGSKTWYRPFSPVGKLLVTLIPAGADNPDQAIRNYLPMTLVPAGKADPCNKEFHDFMSRPLYC